MRVLHWQRSNKLLHPKLQTRANSKIPAAAAAVGLSELVDYSDRSGLLDSNALYRSLVAQLISEGFNQIVLAERMGLKESWFSRWLNEKHDKPLPAPAMDGLLLQYHHLRRLIDAGIAAMEEAPKQARQEVLPARSPVKKRKPRRRTS